MSATPPFGPAYDEQPGDGQRPGEWRPRAGRAQGGPGQDPAQYRNGSYSPGGPQGEQPQGGAPQGGRRPMPQAGRPSQDPRGGVPRAGGPAAGRGPQSVPYQSPQQPPQHQSPQFTPQPGGYESQRPQQGPVTGPTPRSDPRNAGTPPRRDAGSPPNPAGYRPPAGAPVGAQAPQHRDEPFEETAFADDRTRTDWGGANETTAIGKLGYMPKEPRRRSDFQKVRSRARKSSPIPKIIIGVVALALVGGGVWFIMNRPAAEDEGAGADAGLTYGNSDEPCSLVDSGPLESVVDGAEAEPVADAEQKSSGWVQTCSMTYGEPEQATALLEVEGTVFDSDPKASVNFELGTNDLGEMGEAWTPVDPAPAIGDQSAAVARVVTDGTSNYHLHVQDDNVYMVVRLSVAQDAALDQQELTDLTSAIATSYLERWREAS